MVGKHFSLFYSIRFVFLKFKSRRGRCVLYILFIALRRVLFIYFSVSFSHSQIAKERKQKYVTEVGGFLSDGLRLRSTFLIICFGRLSVRLCVDFSCPSLFVVAVALFVA